MSEDWLLYNRVILKALCVIAAIMVPLEHLVVTKDPAAATQKGEDIDKDEHAAGERETDEGHLMLVPPSSDNTGLEELVGTVGVEVSGQDEILPAIADTDVIRYMHSICAVRGDRPFYHNTLAHHSSLYFLMKHTGYFCWFNNLNICNCSGAKRHSVAILPKYCQLRFPLIGQDLDACSLPQELVSKLVH
jgi:hypothetical protein